MISKSLPYLNPVFMLSLSFQIVFLFLSMPCKSLLKVTHEVLGVQRSISL